MDATITYLKRLLNADPCDHFSHLRLVVALKRRHLPYLEEAVAAFLAGAPLRHAGFRRSWFNKHWEPVRYRVNRYSPPELEAGPFSALKGADLHVAEMAQRDLRACSLKGANLEGAYLWKADMRGANLNNARMEGVTLSSSQCQSVDLSFADLTRADCINTDFRGARFCGARLDLANLRGARLDGADFRGASLVAAKLSEWPLANVLTDESTVWPNGLRQRDQERVTA